MGNKILIVEDEASLLKALSDKISSEKFQVLEARNGEDGLKMAKDEHPDLILLDVVMPRMDGMTMVKELRKDKWGKNAKIIILSNLEGVNKSSEALESNVQDYLVKSNWKIEDLMKKIKEVLKK
jgi:two-component system, OmpR family, alkaline phosphatase synthesis response regulator PhoP